MAVYFRIAGSDNSGNPRGFIPPVSDSLEAWFFPSTSRTQTQINLAPGKADGVVVGSPVYEDGYATFRAALHGSGVARMETQAAESASETMLAVFRSSASFSNAANRPVIAGNLGTMTTYGATTVGSAMYGDLSASATLAARVDASGTPTSNTAVRSISPTSTWRFLYGRIDAGVNFVMYDSTAGGGTTDAETRTRIVNTERKYWIGDLPNGLFGGSCDIAFFAKYNRALTTAEIASIYAFVQTDMAAKGITV